MRNVSSHISERMIPRLLGASTNEEVREACKCATKVVEYDLQEFNHNLNLWTSRMLCIFKATLVGSSNS